MNHQNSFTRYHETLDIPVLRNNSRYEMVRPYGVHDSCPSGLSRYVMAREFDLAFFFSSSGALSWRPHVNFARQDMTCRLSEGS